MSRVCPPLGESPRTRPGRRSVEVQKAFDAEQLEEEAEDARKKFEEGKVCVLDLESLVT